MKRDDILWKNILEDVFEDFLRFYFKDAERLFAIERGFTFLDKELEDLYPVDEIRAAKVVDKLVKVFMREGNDEYVLVHIEVQGYRGNNFEGRMYTYFSRIMDKHKKPVVAIAILTDANKQFRPVGYQYECLGTSFVYRFNVYKVADQEEKALLKNNNPFSVVMLTVLLAQKQKKLNPAELFIGKVALAQHLFRRKMPVRKIRRLLLFLRHYVRFANKEDNHNFDRIIRNLTGKKENMGIEEFLKDRAKREGHLEGLKKGLKEGLQKGIQQGVRKGIQQGVRQGVRQGIQRGIQRGIQEGIKKGINKGRKEGVEKGIEKGYEEKTREFVLTLLLNTDFVIDKIANLTGCTEAFVRSVKKSLKRQQLQLG